MNNNNNNPNVEDIHFKGDELLSKRVDKLLADIEREYMDDPETMVRKASALTGINIVLAAIWVMLSHHCFNIVSEWTMFESEDSEDNGAMVFSKIFADDPKSHDRICLLYIPECCEIDIGIYNNHCFEISFNEDEDRLVISQADCYDNDGVSIKEHKYYGIIEKAVNDAIDHVKTGKPIEEYLK
jgi:hypothetical protein